MFELKINYRKLTKQRFPRGDRQKTASTADTKTEGGHEAEAYKVGLKRSREQVT